MLCNFQFLAFFTPLSQIPQMITYWCDVVRIWCA
jgi:hypothetical protein